MRSFVGDDWAEDHHDVEVMNGAGGRLAKAWLPEGVAGMVRLHAIVGEAAGQEADDVEVLAGIETDRGLSPPSYATTPEPLEGVLKRSAGAWRPPAPSHVRDGDMLTVYGAITKPKCRSGTRPDLH
ncbi:hypothetical protein [Actinoallomurus sp. NPDC052274]|uniref:hypothetical protein n=1 Tax=Actinoallomurus sp. NPDC052274 TaxID=3155420 RepID=UPI003427731D